MHSRHIYCQAAPIIVKTQACQRACLPLYLTITTKKTIDEKEQRRHNRVARPSGKFRQGEALTSANWRIRTGLVYLPDGRFAK